MHHLWIGFAAALGGALLLTPLSRAAAVRLNIVDQPDGKRKLQKRPVPLFGGVAVYFSLVIGLCLAQQFADVPPKFEQLCDVVIAAAGFVCLLGCIDDTWDLNARLKLLLQTCSLLPIVLSGFTIDHVLAFGYPLELGWLGVPITVLWLLACINALNLLDGMDGLASVVGLSTAAMLAIIAFSLDHAHVSVVAVTLAGALVGFLVYNLPPASIYLGDSGSMVIGLVVGILGMHATLKTPTTLAITAPLVLMSIPMLDTVLAIVRRKLSGQRFYAADRGHIHHRLLERGLNNWQALGVIGLLCVLTGSAAVAAIILRSDSMAWGIAISVVASMIHLRLFGHHEMSLIKLSMGRILHRSTERVLALVNLPTWRTTADETAANFQPETHRGRITFAESWQTLIDEAATWPIDDLHVTVGRRGMCRAKHHWNRSASKPAASPWIISLAIRQPDQSYCQLEIVGQDAASTESLLPPSAMQALASFARVWSTNWMEVPVMLEGATEATIPFTPKRPLPPPPRSEAA
jgi:UDP-GlcNAc:undecaprenyl-phosphate GlcNAc-1-phosphate transferase